MYLSIDIGGSFIKYAKMSRDGSIIYKGKVKTPKTTLDDMLLELNMIVISCEAKELKGIGLSCPGTIDSNEGIIYLGGALTYLDKFNMKKWLEDCFHVPVTIQNDGKCAALAELWLGSLKDKKDGVVMVLGSGIGGGIVLNGELRQGAHLRSGELSYIIEKVDAITNKGSFLAFNASAVLLIRKIAAAKGLALDTPGEEIFEWIKRKDKEAIDLFDQYCKAIAIQILNIQAILDVERLSLIHI